MQMSTIDILVTLKVFLEKKVTMCEASKLQEGPQNRGPFDDVSTVLVAEKYRSCSDAAF